MRKLIIFATILLLMQVGLIVALNMGNNGTRMTAVDADFLGSGVADANSLTITDGDGKSLELVAKDGGWQLVTSQNGAADRSMVAALLDKLGKLKQGFTVATTAEATKRFKVADDDFERHIVLKKDGNTIADFFLGTSPGFRQVHARKEGESGVVSLALSTFEFDTDPAKWLDKAVLELNKDDIKGLKLKDIVLSKDDKAWKLEGENDGELDQAQADDLLDRVAGLTIENLIDGEHAKQLMGGTVGSQLVVDLADGRSLTYDFVQDGENSYGVKRTDKELVYGVHKIVAEGLLEFTREKLLKKEAVPAESNAADTAEAVENGEQLPAASQQPAESQ